MITSPPSNMRYAMVWGSATSVSGHEAVMIQSQCVSQVVPQPAPLLGGTDQIGEEHRRRSPDASAPP